jgi:hypothetical protein
LIILSKKSIAIQGVNGWWIVACNEDWLHDSYDYHFRNLTPFPEAGVNAIRSEPLLMAYSIDLLSLTSDNVIVLKGSSPDWDVRAACSSSLPDWKRAIAFRAPNDVISAD